MEPRSFRWKDNGLEHHALEWRPEGWVDGSPTAVLVHGFQDAAATWDDVALGLAKAGLRVLAPDMRGFGDGARVPPGGYYYFPDYVLDVHGLLQTAVRTGPLFLIGHSMGATVVSYVAGAIPERITKLALVDGVGPPDNGFDSAPVRMRRWLETMRDARAERKPMTHADALSRLIRGNPDVDEAVLERRLRQLSREVEGGLAWKYDPLHVTTSPLPFYGEAYKAFVRRITCPTLHVGGGEKGYNVPEKDERLACFANLKPIVIEGGHALHWTRPAELTASLLEFWRA